MDSDQYLPMLFYNHMASILSYILAVYSTLIYVIFLKIKIKIYFKMHEINRYKTVHD